MQGLFIAVQYFLNLFACCCVFECVLIVMLLLFFSVLFLFVFLSFFVVFSRMKPSFPAVAEAQEAENFMNDSNSAAMAATDERLGFQTLALIISLIILRVK